MCDTMNFKVDLDYKASPIELVDLGAELASVVASLDRLHEVSDDDLGQSGSCEGWLSERSRLIKDARNPLLLLKSHIEAEIQRSLP